MPTRIPIATSLGIPPPSLAHITNFNVITIWQQKRKNQYRLSIVMRVVINEDDHDDTYLGKESTEAGEGEPKKDGENTTCLLETF